MRRLTPFGRAIPAALLMLGALSASGVVAQKIGWTVAPAVLLDTEFPSDTKIGPGLSAELELNADRTLSWWGGTSIARIDFSVGADQLHRYYGAAAVGVRLVRNGERPALGISLGIGALFQDDQSETDPAFRSSTHGDEMFVPAIEFRLPLRQRWGLSLSVRDQVTGWWYAIVDPDESSVGHRLMIAAGLYHR